MYSIHKSCTNFKLIECPYHDLQVNLVNNCTVHVSYSKGDLKQKRKTS